MAIKNKIKVPSNKLKDKCANLKTLPWNLKGDLNKGIDILYYCTGRFNIIKILIFLKLSL